MVSFIGQQKRRIQQNVMRHFFLTRMRRILAAHKRITYTTNKGEYFMNSTIEPNRKEEKEILRNL
jgi:hypothetical protein